MEHTQSPTDGGRILQSLLILQDVRMRGGDGGEKYSFGFMATHFAQTRDKSLAVVDEVMKRRVPQNAGTFLTE